MKRSISETYDVGDVLTVKGKSSRGKNRVGHLGNKWRILDVAQKVLFDSAPGPWYRIRSIQDQDAKFDRWVNLYNDDDMVIESVSSKKPVINEGGAAGHMMHVYDDPDMTLGELKSLLKSAAAGKLEQVSEKLDGQNIVFTYSPARGVLAARNKTDLKSGGADLKQMAARFEGRGDVRDAFVTSLEVLDDAIATLPKKMVARIFRNGRAWYSAEILYPATTNVISYNIPAVVLHGLAPIEDNAPGDEGAFEELINVVDRMQDAIEERGWKIMGPAMLQLSKLSDKTALKSALQAITSAASDVGLGDRATISQFMHERVVKIIDDARPGLSNGVKRKLASRIVTGQPGVAEIRRGLTPDVAAFVSTFAKNEREHVNAAMSPLETAVRLFAIELLKGVRSALVLNQDEEVKRLRAQVAHAIDEIQQSGDESAMKVLKKQLARLSSVDDIVTAMEGIVFVHNDKLYKFTGAFAPVNQILGIFKYGRTKVKESVLRSIVRKSLLASQPKT